MPLRGSVETTISGLGSWTARLAKLARLQEILQRYGQRITETARALAPVDTAALQASIQLHLEGWAAKIEAGEGLPDARALFQEIGFHHFGSGAFIQNPYLRPAVEQHIAAFLQEIRAALQ